MPISLFNSQNDIQAMSREYHLTSEVTSESIIALTNQLKTEIESLKITKISQMPVGMMSKILQILSAKSKYCNKQPKILKRQNASTFRFNVAATPPNGADFDGDEMAIFMPPSQTQITLDTIGETDTEDI
jgi:hypothetical protein